MAKYYGVTRVDVSSYKAFRSATLGNWYDVDGVYGAQCVDYFKLLNYNIGYSSPYAKTGPNSCSYEMWSVESSRKWNQTGGTDNEYYTLITNLTDVQQGDMMILKGPLATGHNAIAATNYSGHKVVNGKTMMKLLGQNQVNSNSTKGYKVTETWINVGSFLGAFRLKAWNGEEGPSGGGGEENNQKKVIRNRNYMDFPWVLYARGLRRKRG